MSECKTPDERTILDYLNEDCWRAVLDYVPLEDILRTERTSQKWQETVLTYLRGVRINIKTPPRFWRSIHVRQSKWCKFNKCVKKNKVGRVRLLGAACSSFERWTNKLGPSVATAYCDSEDSFKMLGNCPNLENLTVSDRCVNQFMVNNTLEELEIHGNEKVTGQFLILKKPIKLKSLTLKACWALDTAHLLAASDHLGELRKIDLNCAEIIPNNIHLILDKMPKLEHVTVKQCAMAMSDNSIFFMTICRLKHLKYLCVDLYASDADIEAVTRSCPQLRSLRLKASIGVTRHGLAAACAHAGARLVVLAVAFSRYLTNDDIVACIRACPKLKMLSVRECRAVTRELLPRAAAARRELGVQQPLKLRCGFIMYHSRRRQDQYDGLIIAP